MLNSIFFSSRSGISVTAAPRSPYRWSRVLHHRWVPVLLDRWDQFQRRTESWRTTLFSSLHGIIFNLQFRGL